MFYSAKSANPDRAFRTDLFSLIPLHGNDPPFPASRGQTVAILSSDSYTSDNPCRHRRANQRRLYFLTTHVPAVLI